MANMREPDLTLGSDLVKLIAEIDEFKGRWEAVKMLSPDRFTALRKVATIESVSRPRSLKGEAFRRSGRDASLRHLHQIIQNARRAGRGGIRRSDGSRVRGFQRDAPY